MMKLHCVLLAFATCSVLGACSQGPSALLWGEGAAAGVSSGVSLNNNQEAAAMVILQSACTSCHTTSSGPYNVYNLTDTGHLVSSGLVIVGSPSASELYTVIANGSMPTTGALSAADAATIASWISGGN